MIIANTAKNVPPTTERAGMKNPCTNASSIAAPPVNPVDTDD
jgi:hypothetical protein